MEEYGIDSTAYSVRRKKDALIEMSASYATWDLTKH